MNKDLGNILQYPEAIELGDFTLTSGKKSKYYIDIKKAVTKPKILRLISEHVIQAIKDNNIDTDYIACIELGGIPIGTVISFDTGLPLLIIRKEEKYHGVKSRIIGDVEKNKIALLVEDVTTTGNSVISAAKAMRSEGLTVRDVISIVDRDEGAYESLDKEGLRLISLVKAKTLLEDYEIAEALRHSNGIKYEGQLLTGIKK